MVEMVARFESFLLQEITTMMQKPAKDHHSHPSQSVPRLSIAGDKHDHSVAIGFPVSGLAEVNQFIDAPRLGSK
jgi:hypothetical protein